MLRSFLPSLLGSFALLLSACQSSPQPLEPLAISQTLEGEWVDAHGMVSTFHKGMMTTYASDTQEKLAEGNYLIEPAGGIHLQLRSLVRGTASIIYCHLNNNGEELTCQPENEGAAFSLRRPIQ